MAAEMVVHFFQMKTGFSEIDLSCRATPATEYEYQVRRTRMKIFA